MNLQLTLALRYLSGRKLRTVLTTLAILFGVLVIFGTNSLLPSFVQAFQANALALTGQVDASISSKTGEAFPLSTVDKVAAVDGVRAVSGVLERPIGLPADYFDHDPSTPDKINAVNLVGIDPAAARTVTAYNIVAGRFLEASDTNAAIISQSLADDTGLKLGDTLTLPTPTGLADLTIVGLLPPQILSNNERVQVNLPEAQSLMNMPGVINLIEADFVTGNQARRQEIEQNIQSSLGSSFTLGVIQAGAEILTNIRLGQAILNVLGVLALIMGGFIIFNTFRTIVAERRRDIGMLRSIGASRRTIIGLILVEGLIQGVLGTAGGLILGYLAAQVMMKGLARLMSNFLNLQISGVPVTLSVLLVAILSGVGITLLAGLIPARAASRVEPLEALRPVVAEVNRKRLGGAGFWVGAVMIILAVFALLTGNLGLIGLGSLFFIVGLILVAPALVDPIARLFASLTALIFSRDGTSQLAEGNLARQPSRAAITASTTMIALTIVVMAASIISSVKISFTDMLRHSLSSDFLILPPSLATWGLDVGASPELAQNLRAIDGVGVVSSLRFAATQINGIPVGLLGIDPPAYVQTSGLTFIDGDPATAFAEMQNGRAMIINGLLSSRAGIQLGDSVTLLTATGKTVYKVVGIGTDYLNAKTMTGYISQSNIAADFGRKEDVFFQINMKPGANQSAVEAAIKGALKAYPQFKVVAGQEYLDQNMVLFNAMFAGMVGLVLFLAIPSLIAMVNTLAIGVLERRREIGMLRAVGSTRRQVSKVILIEALILSAIGTAFGILAGLYLGYSATGAFAAAGFPASYVFPTSGLLLALASGLIFGAIAAIIPARQAARMEIVAALRYE